MKKFLLAFHNDTDGAVTVDFVVLIAAVVVMGLLVGNAIVNGVLDLSGDIEAELVLRDPAVAP